MRFATIRTMTILAAAAWLAPGARAGEQPGKKVKLEEVTVTGHDGWKLSAFFAAPAAKPGKGKAPAVVLTHMLGRTKEDWKPLVPKLTAAGFAVAAYDVRGHGKSVDAAGKAGSWKKFKAADWASAEKDIAKVRDWLLSAKKDLVDPKRIALAGGSIGANLSLRALTADAGLRGAVLLSAGLDYKGVKTEAPAGKLAENQKIAILATKGDSKGYCAQTADALAKAAGRKKLVIKKIYPGAEHGTSMFGKVKGVEEEIVKALGTIAEPVEARNDVKSALDRVL